VELGDTRGRPLSAALLLVPLAFERVAFVLEGAAALLGVVLASDCLDLFLVL
jgi:hypothetical protein